MDNDDGQHVGLNYELLVEDALRSVVRGSLLIAQKAGLPGDTHFYISFKTDYPGVELADDLKIKHPDIMTIVLQHQYADLEVDDDTFSVTLFFGGKPSPMIVPFASVTGFNDPSVGFGLQFGTPDEDNDDLGDDDETPSDTKDDGGEETSADVVSLDTFRNRPT
jgi:hypothetical protein